MPGLSPLSPLALAETEDELCGDCHAERMRVAAIVTRVCLWADIGPTANFRGSAAGEVAPRCVETVTAVMDFPVLIGEHLNVTMSRTE
jgi:hypothetical protein